MTTAMVRRGDPCDVWWFQVGIEELRTSLDSQESCLREVSVSLPKAPWTAHMLALRVRHYRRMVRFWSRNLYVLP